MKVVHHKKEPYDVLIDRTMIFGNPWTHKERTVAEFIVSSRHEAIDNYRKWLTGDGFEGVLPERRQRILDNLHKLKGLTLGCWCRPLPCHGEVLIELIEGKEPENSILDLFGR